MVKSGSWTCFVACAVATKIACRTGVLAAPMFGTNLECGKPLKDTVRGRIPMSLAVIGKPDGVPFQQRPAGESSDAVLLIASPGIWLDLAAPGECYSQRSFCLHKARTRAECIAVWLEFPRSNMGTPVSRSLRGFLWSGFKPESPTANWQTLLVSLRLKRLENSWALELD